MPETETGDVRPYEIRFRSEVVVNVIEPDTRTFSVMDLSTSSATMSKVTDLQVVWSVYGRSRDDAVRRVHHYRNSRSRANKLEPVEVRLSSGKVVVSWDRRYEKVSWKPGEAFEVIQKHSVGPLIGEDLEAFKELEELERTEDLLKAAAAM
jgi:hypothetical protein